MAVVFEDYSMKCKKAIDGGCDPFLHEVTAEIASQAANNSPFKTGELIGSWSTKVDGKTGYVGSDKEYAIYQEFGTGEYALEGNGRKGGWVYIDENGERHFTRGTKPKRMLWNAFVSLKPTIEARAREIFRGLD